MQDAGSPEATTSAKHVAAEAFWQELASQSWSTSLDYGLGHLEEQAEELLVLVGSDAAVSCLAAAAAADAAGGSPAASDGLCVVQLDGWSAGAAAGEKLESWRQLHPRVLTLQQQV